MIEFGNILRAAGVTVVEASGWRARGHAGSFAPIGGLWHHTAGHGDLDVVIAGRADLAGPLANLYLDRRGVFTVVAAGVAWHAGTGSRRVLDDLRRDVAPTGDALERDLVDDCADGNHYLVGIEVENLGTADDPYPDVQIDALVRGSAALCQAFGWTANRWAHHREWTRRKPDMSYRGDLRGRVDELLNPPAVAPAPAAVPPTTPQEDDDMPKLIVIDAANRPKALLGERSEQTALQPANRLARVFSPSEWTAFLRVYTQGKVPGGVDNLVIETRPVAEYDALTGYIVPKTTVKG